MNKKQEPVIMDRMAESKNFDICIAGCSSYGTYEEKKQ